MRERFDVAVLGAGPAGCAAAITAARRGQSVALLEAGRYPRHKVCGEFVSAEAAGLLAELLLGTPEAELLKSAPHIATAEVFAGKRRVELPIAPAAASIPRYELDSALWKVAIANGVHARAGCGMCIRDQVGDHFEIHARAENLEATRIIDCTGRRTRRGSGALVGVKAHFRGIDVPDSVQLYFGHTGYCGVQPVGDRIVNVCAMLDPRALKEYARDRMRAAFSVHPLMERRRWEQISETVVTTAWFGAPEPLHDGVPCAGDAAGFIDPFLGDGISLALQSGALAGMVADPRQYESEYLRRFLPAFRRAAKLRLLLRAPAAVQRAAAIVMSLPGVGNAVVAATRVSTSPRLG